MSSATEATCASKDGYKLKMILPEEEAINYNTGQNIKISFNINNSYLFTSDTGVSALN